MREGGWESTHGSRRCERQSTAPSASVSPPLHTARVRVLSPLHVSFCTLIQTLGIADVVHFKAYEGELAPMVSQMLLNRIEVLNLLVDKSLR